MKVTQVVGEAGEVRPNEKPAERNREISVPFIEFLGVSRGITAVFDFIERVAESDSTVLIQGESGTGKELAAREIHRQSGRVRGPFVAVNCAALTESLLESELFGYERGAFSGAFTRVKGLIEHANQGTFFLDELTELAPTIQAKLLRVLQERCVTRLGARTSVALDVRFIAATNKNLSDEVEVGNFRRDLYYRLNVVSTTLPPLKERQEDIPLLAEHFLRLYARQSRRTINGFTTDAQNLMYQYHWPGNVRELSNVVQRAILLGRTPLISSEDFPETLLLCSHGAESHPYKQSLTNCRRQTLQMAIEHSGGNLTLAAKLLGVHRNYLYRLMKTLDMRHATPSRGIPSA